MAPCGKKPNKSTNYFKQIFPAFKKKATELSVLCGNSVGFICYGPENDLHVWPEPQDNPQALPEIVGKFNALSDHMRTSHASDLFDLPYLKGLSNEELLRHLAKLNSHSVEIKQKKMSILTRKGISKKPNDDHLRVSDNAATIISNRKASDDRLGSGESGYVSRGFQETVSSLGSSAAASKVFSVSDSSPLTLGLSCGDYFPATDISRVIPPDLQNQSELRSSSPTFKIAPRDDNPNKPGGGGDDDDDLKRAKKNFFNTIFPTFKKKATELSVLCGNSVGFICYGPDNDLHVYPEPQDNPRGIPEIVGKFNGLSDYKRKNHASDLYDFPNLKGLSGDELRNHLINLESHLLGIKQKKLGVSRKENSKPSGDIGVSALHPSGFACGDYLPVDPMEVCTNNEGAWDLGRIDFGFASSLLPS